MAPVVYGRTRFLIREYLDFDFANPPNENWNSEFGGIEPAFRREYQDQAETRETDEQQLVFMTKVVNSEGADLDFVDVAYFIDYSDDNGDTWIQVDDLGTKLSGELLTQSAIVDNFWW